MATITWSIAALDAAATLNGFDDVVRTVHWRVLATEGAYTAEAYGSTLVNEPTVGQPGFVEFDLLTEANVVQWVKDVMGTEEVAAIEANLQAEIDFNLNPPVVSKVLPWTAA